MKSASLIDHARAIQAAWETPRGFQAVQTVEAGGFKIEAKVRSTSPRSLQARFLSATSPLMDMETVLSGWAEYTPEELVDLQFKHEGSQTWIHDPRGPLVVQRTGRHLFEPIPGIALLGELSFLGSLLHDFFLRDGGTGTHDNKPTWRIGLKPKQTYRSHLLSFVTFPIQRATIEVDQETLFPLHISLTPAEDSPAASLLGVQVPVHITYRDVVLLDENDGPALYAPPQDVRLFAEAPADWEKLESSVPFDLSLRSLRHRFPAAHATVRLSLDRSHGRGFALVHLFDDEGPTQGEPRLRLSLLLGNYTCRSMARWRALLSDKGHVSMRSDQIRLLDRAPLWTEAFPGYDLEHVPVDAFFQHRDLFFFFSSAHSSLDELESIAYDLLQEQREAPASPA